MTSKQTSLRETKKNKENRDNNRATNLIYFFSFVFVWKTFQYLKIKYVHEWMITISDVLVFRARGRCECIPLRWCHIRIDKVKLDIRKWPYAMPSFFTPCAWRTRCAIEMASKSHTEHLNGLRLTVVFDRTSFKSALCAWQFSEQITICPSIMLYFCSASTSHPLHPWHCTIFVLLNGCSNSSKYAFRASA